MVWPAFSPTSLEAPNFLLVRPGHVLKLPMLKNIVQTWFVKGKEAKYYNICIEAGKQTTIKAADDANIAMIFTGVRHFRH